MNNTTMPSNVSTIDESPADRQKGKMRAYLMCIKFVLVSGLIFGQTDHVSLECTEEFTIISQAVKDSFFIQVSLPGDYGSSNKNYPILYLLDSDPSFGMVKGIAWWLNFDKLIPDVIIVGIAYKEHWWEKRSRDYTPTKNEAGDWGDWPLAGGADHFIDFLSDELNPALEKYSVGEHSKTVIGHSFGGLLTTYILLTKPSLFDNYISISPALIWNHNYLMTLPLSELQKLDSERHVFTGVGGLDGEKIVKPWEEFNAYISKEKMVRLNWETKFYPDQTHSSVLPVAIADGLRAILGKEK